MVFVSSIFEYFEKINYKFFFGVITKGKSSIILNHIITSNNYNVFYFNIIRTRILVNDTLYKINMSYHQLKLYINATFFTRTAY